MVKITDLGKGFYYPPKMEGLCEFFRFPDGEVKKTGIPNSTIWIFKK